MNIQTNDIAAPAIYSDKEIKEPSKIKTEFFRRYFRVVHMLFAVLLLIQLLPDQLATETYASYSIWFAVGVEALTLIACSTESLCRYCCIYLRASDRMDACYGKIQYPESGVVSPSGKGFLAVYRRF